MRTLIAILFVSLFCLQAQAEELTPICQASPDGSFQEDTRGGNGETDGVSWGKVEGCVLRPLREVWGVSVNYPLMQWDGTDEQHTTRIATSPDALMTFQSEYVVHNFITVRWMMNWDHRIVDGVSTAPKKVRIDYRKVSGTSFISLWEGSIVLEEVAPNVTSVALENRVRAAQTNSEDAESAALDILHKFRTGQPNFQDLP